MGAVAAEGTRRISRKVAIQMMAGFIGGILLATGGGALAKRLHVPLKGMAWSDLLAFGLGIVLLGAAAGIALLTTSRKRLAHSMEGQDAKLPATAEEVRTFLLQAAVLALAAAALLVPALTVGVDASRGWAIFAGLVAVSVLQSALNLRIWLTADEFARKLMLEVATITFFGGQPLLFLWAAAERLRLIQAGTAWEVFTLQMLLYLIVGSAMSIRLVR